MATSLKDSEMLVGNNGLCLLIASLKSRFKENQETLTRFRQGSLTRSLSSTTILRLSMGSTSKGFSLLSVVILALSSLIMVESASAQSISRQPVPEFTLEVTYFTYTPNKIVITIENQPFASSINGVACQLYYNIRLKEHSEETWTERTWTLEGPGSLVPQTNNSRYTTVSISATAYPDNAQIDIQMQAMLGDYTTSKAPSGSPFIPDFTSFGIAADSISHWSNTQTVTLSNLVSPSPTTTHRPMPSNSLVVFLSENIFLTIIPTVAIIALLLFCYLFTIL